MKTYHIFRPLFLLSLFICGINHCKAMNITDDSQDDIPDRLTFGLVCNTESRISSEGVEGVTQESMSTLEQRGITYYE